jgi:cell division septation protein DedD
LITILTKSPVQDKKTGVLEGVELQGEALSETVAAANGWRSMRAVLDVSCSERRDRVRSMTVFSDHNGMGEARILTPAADWTSPDQNAAYGLAALKYFCGNVGVSLGTPKPLPDEPPSANASPTNAPPSAPKLAHVQPVAPTLGGPAPEPNDMTTNNMGAVERPVSAGQKALLTKAIAKPPRTSASGPFAVQVGSATVQADANAILEQLRTAHAGLFGDLQNRIEAADVRGQRHYRALIVGFPDATSAATFCATLHAPNGCIVRRMP